MNEKEKRDFYMAMCRCCLIAQAMKSCAVCRFKVGLVDQETSVDARAIPMLVTGQITRAIQQVALHAQVDMAGSQHAAA